MASNQATEVRLLHVPYGKDGKHTWFYNTKEEQMNDVLYSTKHVFRDCSYQRKEKYFAVSKGFDEIQDCNYLVYRNDTSSRYYFAFITRMEYKSDSVTWVYFEIDAMQTYLNEYTVHPSFVEREHVHDDTIGTNTVPEGLEMGEYIPKYAENVEELADLWTVLGVTADPEGNEVSNVYNGLYSGVGYVAFPGAKGAENLIKQYASSTKVTTEAITSMFMYPSIFIDSLYKNTMDENPEQTFSNCAVIGSTSPKTLEFSMSRRSAYDYSKLYTPKNNKLKTYPYIYLLVSNNNGASAIYEFEHFLTSGGEAELITFKIDACICPGGSVRMVPKAYKGLQPNNEEGLNLGKFAIGNWASDEYTNWLTQNGVNIGINMITGIGQIVGGVALTAGTGGVGAAVGGGSIVGGVSTITNQLSQIHQMSMTPPQAHGNINCGDVVTATKQNTFTFYTMTIKPEYMRIIDDYFQMFGYKVNKVKVPYKNHRARWWYTKTIDVNITGNIPEEDLQKIKDCYNSGITFWKSNFGDYDTVNEII